MSAVAGSEVDAGSPVVWLKGTLQNKADFQRHVDKQTDMLFIFYGSKQGFRKFKKAEKPEC